MRYKTSTLATQKTEAKPRVLPVDQAIDLVRRQNNDPVVTLYHGSRDNYSFIVKNGFTPSDPKKSPAYVALDRRHAVEAITKYYDYDPKTPQDRGIIAFDVPKAEIERLIKSGDIQVRNYKGMYGGSGQNDPHEFQLSPRAIEVFNQYRREDGPIDSDLPSE